MIFNVATRVNLTNPGQVSVGDALEFSAIESLMLSRNSVAQCAQRRTQFTCCLNCSKKNQLKSLLMHVVWTQSSTSRTKLSSVIMTNMEASALSALWGFTCRLSVQMAYDKPRRPH